MNDTFDSQQPLTREECALLIKLAARELDKLQRIFDAAIIKCELERLSRM